MNRSARLLFGLVALVTLGAVILAWQQSARQVDVARDVLRKRHASVLPGDSVPDSASLRRIYSDWYHPDSATFRTIWPSLPPVWKLGREYELTWADTRLDLSAEVDSTLRAVAIEGVRRMEGRDTLNDSLVDGKNAFTMRAGRLFGTEKSFIYVKARIGTSVEDFASTVAVAIYPVANGRLASTPVLRTADFALTFVGDTFRDVNGDRRLDYLSRHYPPVGVCCLRNIDCIHLYDSLAERLNDGIVSSELYNATYYPEEGIIRGVAFGHSLEAPLYKARFKGHGVEMVEYLFPYPPPWVETSNEASERQVYIRWWTGGTEVLYSVPEEYRTVDALYWFLGDVEREPKSRRPGGAS